MSPPSHGWPSCWPSGWPGPNAGDQDAEELELAEMLDESGDLDQA